MSKHPYGPSLYYASDKNIFDALNQHKVDQATIRRLFRSRNILVSPQDSREELADYFSRLTHDYFDHQEIANRLGIVARRERITSMNLIGGVEPDHVSKAINLVKKGFEEHGDRVVIKKNGSTTYVEIEYTTIDYKRSEFSQVQQKDGTIEVIQTTDGLVIRNTKNDYLDGARDQLIAKLSSELKKPLTRREISLFDIPDYRLRSKFFINLASKVGEFSLSDVTAAYVYKPRGESSSQDAVPDTFIERVNIRGRGVTRSGLMSSLDNDKYYIVKIVWRAREKLGKGREFEIEALFSDPKDCTGFSFLLSGVYERESDGELSERRHLPSRNEVDEISKAVERSASEALDAVRAEFDNTKARGT
jgi:hypothetical protein